MLDGMGMMRLILALLSPNIDHLPTESLETIAPTEDTIDIRPPYALLLPEIWRELILPNLPQIVQNYFEIDRPRPYFRTWLSPNKAPSAAILFELDIDLVTRPKLASKIHGVPTLHPTLMMGYFATLWSVRGSESIQSSKPVYLRGASMRSERGTAPNQGYCTGNYASTADCDIFLEPIDDFWVEASKIPAYLNSDSIHRESDAGYARLHPRPGSGKTAVQQDGRIFFTARQRDRLHSDTASACPILAIPSCRKEQTTCSGALLPRFYSL